MSEPKRSRDCWVATKCAARARGRGRTLPACVFCLLLAANAAVAQPAGRVEAPPATEAIALPAAAEGLPDAPLAMSARAIASRSTIPEAGIRQHDIDPGQLAPPLTAGDKVAMGLRGTFSLFAAGGWIFASGYEQLSNGAPNWGTDRGAFGQRLGSAALRGSSEDLLRGSVMMPLLHQDPRYYRLGPGHNPLARALYAATRPLISRTDGGRATPNFALFAGNLAGAALTNAYCPPANRSVHQTFATFGSGLGGAAIGDAVAEFFGRSLLGGRLQIAR